MASIFGPDLLVDLHDQVIASLRDRAEAAFVDMHEARGHLLQSRCLTLAGLPQEMSVLAAELAERERTWELKGRPWLEALKTARVGAQEQQAPGGSQ